MNNILNVKVRVWIDRPLTDEVLRNLNHINSDILQIRQFQSPLLRSKGSAAERALRYLMVEIDDMDEYKYLYFGDIDIFLTDTSFIEKHIKHMDHIKLPYSNVLRDSGTTKNRLTGLHFVESITWGNMVLDRYDELLSIIENNYIDMDDEEILYLFCYENNVGIPNSNCNNFTSVVLKDFNNECYRPHNGFHFGIFRNGVQVNLQFIQLLLSDVYIEYYKKLKTFLDDEKGIRLSGNQSKTIQLELLSIRRFYKVMIPLKKVDTPIMLMLIIVNLIYPKYFVKRFLRFLKFNSALVIKKLFI